VTIDKQKLQKLLWSEVASWKADCGEWKQNIEALGEFLGEKTVEEVALELLAENKRLRDFLSDISKTSGDKGAVMGARQLLEEFGP
jgi:regulator of replication initiation timing